MIPSLTDPLLAHLTHEIQRGAEIAGGGDQRGGLVVLHHVLQRAAQLGLNAPDAAWAAAVAHDNLGELDKALEFARQALEQDPVSPSYRRSFEIICHRTRLAMRECGSLDQVELLYRQLLRAGAADLGSHLRFGEVLIAAGRHGEARDHLLAVAKLEGGSSNAWSLLAHLAVLTDDKELAERCGLVVAGRNRELGQLVLPVAEA